MYALNIKACNHYKLYNGTAAEVELKALANAAGTHLGSIDNDLVRHNVAVFRNGENALQVEFLSRDRIHQHLIPGLRGSKLKISSLRFRESTCDTTDYTIDFDLEPV